MNQRDLFDAAVARREVGIQQAAEHADRVKSGWADDAMQAVRRAVAEMPAEFTFEQLRLADEVGLDAPPDLRAWGNVARRSQREKVIVPTGRYAPRASGNCTPTMLYQRPEAS